MYQKLFKALLGELIIEKTDKIALRSGRVIRDVIIEKDYFQLRTHAMGDNSRERGSKQNIQLDRKKALELVDLLEKFLSQER